jgi:hypothetical protein
MARDLVEESFWVPERFVDRPYPTDGNEAGPPLLAEHNAGTAPEDELLLEEERRVGVVKEPEVGRVGHEVAVAGYSDTYWTHFDWREDVARAVARVQKKFPYLTYANTYYCHPPVYGRAYEFQSADLWGGGLAGGYYYGYRGKPIGSVVDGWDVFDALFYDPYLPNIYWIIFGGYMWTRGYGWGPAPWGPPDSDPGHHAHIHVTFV